jgi:DNA-binding NarL/FixJ family response regulator
VKARESHTADNRINVLLVMDPATPCFAAIRSCLEERPIRLTVVSDCRRFRRQLRTTKPTVVITGVTLSDGNWCEVLGTIVEHGILASVVVHSQERDERLRSEAIARGAYGLIWGEQSASEMQDCIETAHLFRTDTRTEKPVRR